MNHRVHKAGLLIAQRTSGLLIVKEPALTFPESPKTSKSELRIGAERLGLTDDGVCGVLNNERDSDFDGSCCEIEVIGEDD